MGYGYYTIGYWGFSRPCGYMVIATCDARGCDEEINRGLGYLCGENPHDEFSDELGCGRYYCGEHLGGYGQRGGCSHRRQKKEWSRVLSDMVPNDDGSVVCLDPSGHKGPHAWAVSE